MANHYSEKKVDDWTVNDFLAYMNDRHTELFGVEYMPFGSWAAERGRLGKSIGTQKKAGEYPKEVIKRFIDECFKTYRPTAQYPGINYGFMETYRKQDLQRIIVAYNQEKKDEEAQAKQSEGIGDEILDWFSS